MSRKLLVQNFNPFTEKYFNTLIASIARMLFDFNFDVFTYCWLVFNVIVTCWNC